MMKIRNKTDRKLEVKRLESNLEQLLIKLGLAPNTTQSSSTESESSEEEVKEEIEVVVEEPPPTPVIVRVQKHQEDNKLGQPPVIVIEAPPAPVVEIVKVVVPEPEPEVIKDSFIYKVPYGFIGIGSGTASPPMEMEIQTEEVIDIIKPLTYDPMSPGLNNISPRQFIELKKLAHMNDNDINMSKSQKHDMEILLDIIENGDPIDGQHKGMINLTIDQSKQFNKLYSNHQQSGNAPHSSNMSKKLSEFLNQIVHGIPLNSKHPSVINLAPDQKRHLKAIEKKQGRSQALRPAEEEKLNVYKELIATGQPIDSSHPGMVNLTEHEKDWFIALEDKDEEELLTPEERIKEDKLKNCIVSGVPLDMNHKCLKSSLSPIQEEQFLRHETKKDDGHELNPEEKNQLNTLQELLRAGEPIDEKHPG